MADAHEGSARADGSAQAVEPSSKHSTQKGRSLTPEGACWEWQSHEAGEEALKGRRAGRPEQVPSSKHST